MKKATIIIQFEQEKLRALEFYIAKKDSTLEAEIDDFMAKLYEKHVPPRRPASTSKAWKTATNVRHASSARARLAPCSSALRRAARPAAGKADDWA